MEDLLVSDSLRIPARFLSWTAVRASGPGGQNVNQVATKVELRFDLDACDFLAQGVKKRLRALPGARFTAEGLLLVVSQENRQQERNLQRARTKLAEMLRQALIVPRRRRATRPTLGSKRRRVEGKRQRSATKRLRGRVKDD